MIGSGWACEATLANEIEEEACREASGKDFLASRDGMGKDAPLFLY